jgi:VanZ family protein
MCAGTHWPTAPHAPFGYADKWMHFSAYGGLALLFSIAMAMRRRMTLAISVAIVALLAGYGAFDEVTQPLVGRDCDLFDWFADVTGLLIGTSCFWLGSLAWRRRPNRAV